MRRNSSWYVFALGMVAVLAVPALGQELRGRITGVITDNSGGVLPGATVTATSPALIQPQTTTSGDDGSYFFPALPSGLYTLTFELSGFQTLKREQIRVVLNTTLTVNAQLQIATLQETVTITSESPVVDTTTTTVGTNFTKELLTDLPNARDIWAAMAQAPGIQMTGYDVGGSHTGTQTGFATYGITGQNKTLLEGINVTEGQNSNAGYFDFGSFEELQLGGSGNMGEQSGIGGFMNLTIKSGGDRFAGQFYYDHENEHTVSDNVPDGFTTPGSIVGGFKAPSVRDPATGQLLGLQRGNPITKQYDFNVGGGGPAIRQRVWFYAGYRDNNQYKTILGLPGEEAQSQLKNFTAKVTWQLTKSNQIIGFYNQRTKLQPLRDLSAATPVSAARWQASTNRPQKIEWTSVLTNRAFLDLQFSHWGNYFPLFPTQTQAKSVEGVPVGRIDLNTNQRTGAHSTYHDRVTLKPQLSGSLAYFQNNWLGTHNFKVGFERYRERRSFWRGQPGNIFYRDRGAAPSEVDIYNTPNEAIDDANHLSIYGQDGWNLTRRLTLNLGVRYDRYVIGWPAQSFTPEQSEFWQPVSTPDTTVGNLNSVSPRVGFAFDVTGRGKTVVKGFYGRFYYNPSTDVSERENPISQAAQRWQFRDQNGNGLVDGRHELGSLLTTVGGGGAVRIDRDLEHAYGEELSSHVEHELMEAMSVRASYVFKSQRNGWAEVDLARVNAYTIPFAFTDPGPDNQRGTSDDQQLSLFDRARETPSERTFTNPGRVPGVPVFEGDYHTVEFALNRRLKGKWLLLTSFEHTWANDFRGTDVDTGSLDVARQGQEFLWQPNRRRFGQQETTFWNYKLNGRYLLPFGFATGVSYKLQSGYNVARTITVPLPNAGNEVIHAHSLTDNRAANVHIVDYRFEKSIDLGGRRGKLVGLLDIFNALNSDTIVNYRVITGPAYNEIIALLDPRMIRFGVRWDF